MSEVSRSTPRHWGKGMGGKTKKFTFDKKPKKSENEKDEIKRLKKEYEQYDSSKIKSFKNMPLSFKTLSALKTCGYLTPTEIQKESIGLALRGLDILGAAKTGSGKTLAFLIPVLEALNSKLWTKQDGLGALIITPTRELAYQIFEALKKIGKYHEFSAGLIIGGKDLKFERKRMDQLNIVICTPGRLLQHMDENASFDCSNLQVLVLDEADRCLDMGFEQSMNAIIEHLPTERQTLLFSATQTKSVRDLARLSLNSPVYVSVHENSEFSTPESLQQSYIVCPLELKLDMLWSFIKHHRKSKILVFLSSCKQVRFVHMLFCRMRPGMSLLALYGTLHQLKRMNVYEEFTKKQAVVLFATDIAARGLDFPAVDWVLQLDCPEDATTYIHRAGRTARFNKNGEALLTLLPSEEEGMIEELKNKKIPIEKIDVNNKKLVSVKRKFEALLARDVTLKECAQRAFKAYLKSCFLMKNKKIFDISQLDLPSFANSLGLAIAPRVRFLQKRLQTKNNGTTAKDEIKEEPLSDDENEDDQDSNDEKESIKEEEDEQVQGPKDRNKYGTFDFDVGDDEEGCDDLFVGRKELHLEADPEIDEAAHKLLDGLNPGMSKSKKSKTALAKKMLKKKILPNKKTTFDDEGSAVADVRRERQSDLAREYEDEDTGGIDIARAKEVLKMEDQIDKKIHRERIKAKHKEERKKAKMARKGITEEDQEEAEAEMEAEAVGVELGGASGSDYESEEDGEGPDLSWLPDPDKVYSKDENAESGSEEADEDANQDSDEDNDDDVVEDDEEEEEMEERAPPKRKARVPLEDDSDNEYTGMVVNSSDDSEDDAPKRRPQKIGKDKKRKKLDKLDKNAMEELALQLLRK